MRLLLDTHVWLWAVGAPGKLGKSARAAIEDAANERWISPISIWEVLLLAEKQRIELNKNPDDWIADARQDLALREAPITGEVALATRTIRLPHGDPADAFIAASAKVYELTLVTADRNLRAVKGISVL